jgi:hypothetical protein
MTDAAIPDPRELAEREGKPLALAWIVRALAALDDPESPLSTAGFWTNFAWRRVPERAHARRIAHIRATFEGVRSVIEDSERTFAGATLTEARKWFPSGGLPPSYAIWGDRIYFTPAFEPWDEERKRGLGPLCRTAMVLHEAVHLVDPRSGEPAVHVSEWDEPRFSELSPDQTLHNPSSYASFAAQMHEERLEWPASARFGAGNRAL